MGGTRHLRLCLFAIGCLVLAPACFKDLTIEEACEGGDCSNARGGTRGTGGMIGPGPGGSVPMGGETAGGAAGAGGQIGAGGAPPNGGQVGGGGTPPNGGQMGGGGPGNGGEIGAAGMPGAGGTMGQTAGGAQGAGGAGGGETMGGAQGVGGAGGGEPMGGAQGAGGMNGERVPLDGDGLIIQCSLNDQNTIRPDPEEVDHVEWNTATGQRDIIWVYRRDDYCHWLEFCSNAMADDQACMAHADIVNDLNLEQLAARQQMATNLSMCKANNCMDSIAPAECLLTNCSEQLAACGYVQPVGRVKWFKFGPPVGLPENTAQWEIEVRSAVDGVAGRPWIFVYTWSDDCEGPLQLQGELQTTNAGACGEDPEDPEDPDIPQLHGTRISLRHPGHFIVGVGDQVNDVDAVGKQFLLRVVHLPGDTDLEECQEDSECGRMSGVCSGFGCSLLSAEPAIRDYPAFQCIE